MNTFQIKTSSWHYKIANKFYKSDFLDVKFNWRTLDICEYRGFVIKSVLMLIILYSLGGLFTYGLIDLSLALWFGLMPGLAGLVVAISITGVVLAVLTVWVFVLIAKHWPSKDNFVPTAYKSWREKFCVKTEIIED